MTPISGPTVDTLPLPHQLYLLSHRAEKGRLDDDSEAVRGSLLAAAAVAELCIVGLLSDRDGKAAQTNARTPERLDPFLVEVLGDVPPDRARSWFELLERRWLSAEDTVRDQLSAAGLVTVEHRKVFGPIRTTRIAVTHPRQVDALRERVRDAARSGGATAPLGDAVLAALVVDGLVGTVFRWRDLRAHKTAIRALTDRVDRELPGLRKALSYSIAARRAG